MILQEMPPQSESFISCFSIEQCSNCCLLQRLQMSCCTQHVAHLTPSAQSQPWSTRAHMTMPIGRAPLLGRSLVGDLHESVPVTRGITDTQSCDIGGSIAMLQGHMQMVSLKSSEQIA